MKLHLTRNLVVRILFAIDLVLGFGFVMPLIVMNLLATNEFKLGFWANYLSTALGVGLGIPIALWLNEQALSESGRLQNQENHKRLMATLRTLHRAIESNSDRFVNLGSMLKNGTPVFSTQLDTSTWDAVKSEVIPLLRDPIMQSRLAYHFSQVNEINRLFAALLDYSTGQESGYPISQDLAQGIISYLLQALPNRMSETKELLAMINVALERVMNFEQVINKVQRSEQL